MASKPLLLGVLAWIPPSIAACAASGGERDAAPPLEFSAAPEAAGREGDARGFPALRTLAGERLADGEFTQWLEDERVQTRIRYDFGPGHWVEERSVLRQEPALVQERWSWVEVRDEAVQRRFEVDFLTGAATAEKLEEGALRRWSEQLSIEPGRAFAGSAWALAIKGTRARLIGGETVHFQAVGFTPKPRLGSVAITHEALDRVPMAGRAPLGDRFRIHPEIPWILRAFVHVPDSVIWLTHPEPAAFLRWEGPLAEPGDDVVRVDLLPGERSAVARPAGEP